jgi:Tol biopolymer transport system component
VDVHVVLLCEDADPPTGRPRQATSTEGDHGHSPEGNTIISSQRTGKGDLYTIKTNGTALTRITITAALETTPAWSPR